MRLHRFVLMMFRDDVSSLAKFGADYEGVAVLVLRHRLDGNRRSELMVVAKVDLDDLPAVNEAGEVEVPDQPRRRAERAIEVVADLLSVAMGCGRSLASPRTPVAFEAQTEDERDWLGRQARLSTEGRGIGGHSVDVALGVEHAMSLGDRLAGAALMSEALRQSDLTAKVRALILLFERAFATKPSQLKKPVREFLAHWQALDYTMEEVAPWFEQIRGRAMHADKRDALIEADVRPVIGRVTFAAYDALLNKRSWATPVVDRRDLWTPNTGPLSRDGRWFVCQHTTPRTTHTIYDAFGAYPLALNSDAMDLGEDRWPRLSPDQLNAPAPSVRILPADDLRKPLT